MQEIENPGAASPATGAPNGVLAEEPCLDITPDSCDARTSCDDSLFIDTKETALAAALAAVSGAENEFAKLLAVRNGVEGLLRLDYGAAIDEFAAACISECSMSFTVVQAAVERGKNHAELPQGGPPDPKPSVIDIGPSPEILKLAKLHPPVPRGSAWNARQRPG
jgi:hypothetical protein